MVNGRKVHLGDRANPEIDHITIDGIEVDILESPVYYILNKPRDVISTTADTHGRKTVLDFLPEKIALSYRLFPVGRLDMDSTGLILLTNDGFLANRLLHPKFEVPREYIVEVSPSPGDKELSLIRSGIELEDGKTSPAKASVVAKKGASSLVRIVLKTGKKRQIRRMFEALGLRVVSLSRVRFGSLSLGNLKPGEVRELDREEVKKLYRDADLL